MIIQLQYTSRCQQVGGIHGTVRLAGTDQQVRLKRQTICGLRTGWINWFASGVAPWNGEYRIQ